MTIHNVSNTKRRRMDEINRRLENATVKVARLLGTVDREVLAKNTIELELEKQILDVQKQQLCVMIRQMNTIVEIRQQLSGLRSDYHEAIRNDTRNDTRKDTRNETRKARSQRGRPRWLNGCPIYDN